MNYRMRIKYWTRFVVLLILACVNVQCDYSVRSTGEALEEGFKSPPQSANPGVYWYFMDGNLSKEGITKDLESMARVGISHAIFLKVRDTFIYSNWTGMGWDWWTMGENRRSYAAFGCQYSYSRRI